MTTDRKNHRDSFIPKSSSRISNRFCTKKSMIGTQNSLDKYDSNL